MSNKNMDAPPTRADSVMAEIRRDIVRGKLAPGSALREPELCRSLGVSRVTVREALRRLQEEGLVTVYPHHGTFVTELNRRTAHELYSLRGLLEPYAVRLATEEQAYSEKCLHELEELARCVGEHERQGQVEQALKVDMEFHLKLCEPSEHQLLIATLKNLQAATMRYAGSVGMAGIDVGIDQPDSPHLGIVDAVRSGSPERAELAVKRHVEQALSMILERLAKRQQGPGADADLAGRERRAG